MTTTEGEPEESNDELMSILKGIAHGQEVLQEEIQGIKTRVKDLETGGTEKFKREARAEDIELAAETRDGIDPKISRIVDEILGSDFGVRITPHDDKPGFLFTILVPERLSPVERAFRPVLGEDGKYKKDPEGNTVTEEYFPEDRRSRQISSTASYDVIREHCNRVRANIVGYYQKAQKPIPEFHLK